MPRASPDTTTSPDDARSVDSASAMRSPLVEQFRAPTSATARADRHPTSPSTAITDGASASRASSGG